MDTLRVLLSLIMLGYTSWLDFKTREIYDVVWLVFGTLGLIISLYEIYTGTLSIFMFAGVILVTSAISVGLGYFGLFGGADVLAFITLTVLHPLPPQGLEPFLGLVSPIFSLTLFSNSALSGVSYSLIQLLRNISLILQGKKIFIDIENVPVLKKIIIMFTGHRMKVDSVRGPPFQYPLEIPESEDSQNRKLILMPDIQDDKSAEEIFKFLKVSNIEEVWVSNTLPFLIFITTGYILSLILGDIALAVIKSFFTS